MANKKMKGTELVAFCRSKIGTPYVYGAKGQRMTEAKFNELQGVYGEKLVWNSDRQKVGKICVDCSGLISWACGVCLGSTQWMNRASVKEPISTIEQAPVGALVWMKGHIGVYTGMRNGHPYYVAADGSAYGVREVPLKCNNFTHWLLVESVFDYEMEEEEMVEKDTIIVNGKKYQVDMIRKDGITYIKTRDFAEVAGYQVSSQGKIPVLVKE